jgi:hypothetical protein
MVRFLGSTPTMMDQNRIHHSFPHLRGSTVDYHVQSFNGPKSEKESYEGIFPFQ